MGRLGCTGVVRGVVAGVVAEEEVEVKDVWTRNVDDDDTSEGGGTKAL